MPGITNSIQSCNGDTSHSSQTRGGEVKELHKKGNKVVTIYKKWENVIANVEKTKESTNNQSDFNKDA